MSPVRHTHAARHRGIGLVALVALLSLPLAACSLSVGTSSPSQSAGQSAGMSGISGEAAQSGVRAFSEESGSVRGLFDEATDGLNALPVLRGVGPATVPIDRVDGESLSVFFRCDREEPVAVELVNAAGERQGLASATGCPVPAETSAAGEEARLEHWTSPELHDVTAVRVEVPEGVAWVVELFRGPASDPAAPDASDPAQSGGPAPAEGEQSAA